MKIKNIKFTKEGTAIKMPFVFCECDTQMVQKGYAGCSHIEEYSYIYQCPSCKNIEIFSYSVEKEFEEDLAKAGWIRKDLKTKE